MDGTLRIPSVTGIDVELHIAGPGARSFAFVIDWLIRVLLAGAWFVASSVAMFGTAGLAPPEQGGQVTMGFFVAAPSLLIYFLYHPVLEVAMAGRTPGKRIAGVRIVRRDGGVPGTGALLIRNLFRIIDWLPAVYCFGLAATMLTKHAVRVGDIAAGTLLVYDGPNRPSGFSELSSRGVERLGLEQAGLVRELLNRWDELEPGVRSMLARRLLENIGAEPGSASRQTVAPASGEGDLRHALRRLLQ